MKANATQYASLFVPFRDGLWVGRWVRQGSIGRQTAVPPPMHRTIRTASNSALTHQILPSSEPSSMARKDS